MKKGILAVLLSFVIFFTSGCAKQKDSYKIIISQDNKISVTETIALEKDALNGIASVNEISSETINSMGYSNYADFARKILTRAKGFRDAKVENFEDQDYIGITQSFNDIDLERFDSTYLIPGLTAYKASPIILEKGVITDSYLVRMRYNFQLACEEFEKKYADYMLMKSHPARTQIIAHSTTFKDNNDGTYTIKTRYKGEEGVDTNTFVVPNPEITLTIKTPVRAKKHNATRIVGKNEYQWDLFSATDNVEIYLEYCKINSNLPGLLVIIFLFASLGALSYFFVKVRGDVSI